MTDLNSVALDALRINGFTPQENDAMRRELAALKPAVGRGSDVRDLRTLLWSSIDNASTRDLDQIEVAEQQPDGGIRIRVGIADVDALVPKGSAIDAHAMANATSLYTGIAVYPMLPDALSTGLTSLNEGAERVVLVIEVTIAKDGAVLAHDVYRGFAVNRAQLAYETVGPWLEGRGPIPPKVASTPGLEDQLWLQDRAASVLKQAREQAGALQFDTVEATVTGKDGKVDSIVVTRKNRARDLIEDFMIAANVAIAQYLAEQNRSAIRRIVRVPKRWSRIVEIAAQYGTTLPSTPDAKALSVFLGARRAADPLRFPDLPGPADDEGHFGLAAHDYTHATAPNRRYADLVTQRLVKAAIAKVPAPYTNDELAAIARQCTDRENAANRVERVTRKAAAAILLAHRIGTVFDAIVTGVNADGTYVRLLSPPAEGRVMRGEAGMDVGERVRVRLLSTDPARGFIDFEGVA